MIANSYVILLSVSDKVKLAMADACVETACYKMTCFQQVIVMPLLAKFTVILRHFSMYPPIAMMAITHSLLLPLWISLYASSILAGFMVTGLFFLC